MSIHVLFCPVSILLPLAYKKQMWHFPSLVFPLQQIGAWELLHCLKDCIYKKASAGEKKIGSDFFLNFVVRAEWMCGSSYTHELSKPHIKCWGTEQGRAHHVLQRHPWGRGSTQNQQVPVLIFCLLFSWVSLSKYSGPREQDRAQVSLKLARGVKNNKVTRSPGWFLLFKSYCKSWNGRMKPSKWAQSGRPWQSEKL